jgi:hypothetical protein
MLTAELARQLRNCYLATGSLATGSTVLADGRTVSAAVKRAGLARVRIVWWLDGVPVSKATITALASASEATDSDCSNDFSPHE